MSTLMLIRYPVSYPPSLHQIESLPQEVYDEWLKDLSYKHGLLLSSIITGSREFTHTIIERMYEKDPSNKDLIDALVRVIYNLDE